MQQGRPDSSSSSNSSSSSSSSSSSKAAVRTAHKSQRVLTVKCLVWSTMLRCKETWVLIKAVKLLKQVSLQTEALSVSEYTQSDRTASEQLWLKENNPFYEEIDIQIPEGPDMVTSLSALCLALWTSTCLCLIVLFKRASKHILRPFYSLLVQV